MSGPRLVRLDAGTAAALVLGARMLAARLEAAGRRPPAGLTRAAAELAHAADNGGHTVAYVGASGDGGRHGSVAKPLTIREAARLLGCSTRTVRRRLADGRLPAIRDQQVVRIHPADLATYLEKHTR